MSRPLTVGAFSPSVLLRTAQRLGLPDVAEVPVASSPAQFRALLKGEIDAALTSPDNVIAYRHVPANPLGLTADVRIVSAVDRGLGLALYGRPGLGSAAELAGEVVGVDVPDSGYAFALYAALEALGLRPGDYRLATLGSTPRRLEALLSGGCAATMLNAGADLRAEDAGAVRLAGVPRPYLGTVLCSLGAAPAVRTLADTLRETTTAILAGRVDDLVTEEAATALRLPPAAAARYLRRLKDPDEGLVAGGRADVESLSTVLGLRRRYGTAPDGDLLSDLGDERGR
ncbi:ABC-type nitrate/sulfonate/bicarbonate transport system, substrate-binding protein [Nonomuraea solani]|uniref:ABC-type nitrate/sulfonate/bicarbonate transport system, substrate-binding protein n=1 Tax=Nonomuraea solani TaxID=1144553 RepID=A0A1H5UQF7_9ACTN|nr:ABC transporter substrate-binding protein [Nonomuraea solani]SEF77312.1 ABC-type nitrate/sulfonate/bicarbonate transport system, substrate-binding protein [Nonomuraea solani]